MESKMQKYEREVIFQLLDRGFYVKKPYGVLMVGETHKSGFAHSVATHQMEDRCIIVPHNAISFQKAVETVNGFDEKSKARWFQVLDVFRRGLTALGEFERQKAECNPCSNCHHGFACDNSCPHLTRGGYTV